MKNKKIFYKLILLIFIIAVFSVKFKDKGFKDKACNTYSELIFDIESADGGYSDNTKVSVFIHSDHELNNEEINVIENLGAKVYKDSWIPPVYNHPTGFYNSSIKLGNVCKLNKLPFIKEVNSAMGKVDIDDNNFTPSVVEPLF